MFRAYFINIEERKLYTGEVIVASKEAEEVIVKTVEIGLPSNIRNYDFRDVDTGAPLHPIEPYTFLFKTRHWYRVVEGVKLIGYLSFDDSDKDISDVKSDISSINTEFYDKEIASLEQVKSKIKEGIQSAELVRAEDLPHWDSSKVQFEKV